jgi:hypothetical protein
VRQAERGLGRLDGAVVVTGGAPVALEALRAALREALGDRPAIEVGEDGSAEEAVRAVIERVFFEAGQS